jgi:hypothetical protein
LIAAADACSGSDSRPPTAREIVSRQMKILVFATEYSDFLRLLHARMRGLGKWPHEDQMPVGAQSLLGWEPVVPEICKVGGRFLALIGLQRLT